jgi:hypothetical protein
MYISPIKKEDEQSPGTNVLGTGSPNQQPPQNPQQQQVAPQQQQGAPVQQPAQPKSASSGMFTGIKKYMQANQPAAEKMATNIGTGQVAGANKIAQQANLQKQKTQQQIQANQNQLGQAYTQAANIVQSATGQNVAGTIPQGYQAPTPVTPNNAPNTQTPQVTAPIAQPTQQAPTDITDEQKNMFASYLAGNAGTSQIQDLDFTDQRQGLDQIKQMARGITGEEGRANALYNVYGKQRAYTTGQTGLDSALLGKAAPQLQELSKKLAETEMSKRNELQGIESDIGGQLGMQRQDISKFGENIKGLTKKAADDTSASVNAQLATSQAEQDAMLADLADGIDVSQVGNYVTDEQLTQSAKQTQDTLAKASKFLQKPGNETGFGNKDDVKEWDKGFAAATGITGKQAYQIYNSPNGKQKLDQIVSEAQAKSGDLNYLKQQFADRSKRENLSGLINKTELGRQNVVTDAQLKAYENLQKLTGGNMPTEFLEGRVDAGRGLNAADTNTLMQQGAFGTQQAGKLLTDSLRDKILSTGRVYGSQGPADAAFHQSKDTTKQLYNELKKQGLSDKQIKQQYGDVITFGKNIKYT